MASTGSIQDLQTVVALIKTLINAQLKQILRSENLPVSGVKSTLESRIIEHLNRLTQSGQSDQYTKFKKFIYATARRPMPTTPTHPSNAHQHTEPQTHPSSATGTAMSSPFSSGRLTFKESPFFTILEPLAPVGECKVREHTRDSLDIKITLNASVAAKLQADKNIRVMIYCAADNGLNQYSKSDIAFPHQVEIKANLDEVKANLRGLKNKPGSTRPADITNFIRKKPGYPNHVVITYALTQKKFYVLANLVQRHPVEELVARLKARKTISRDQVLREMRSKAEDSDIVATSTIMSLKCPLSTLRIEVPCRTTMCTHNQCFDASSFLQLQEQAPTWACPVCNKATSFAGLQIDQYVDDILRSTPSAVEQVTVEPKGDWSKLGDPGSDMGTGNESLDVNADDDLIEIKDTRLTSLKEEPKGVRLSLQHITPERSREQSTGSSGLRQSSGKRPSSQVIDLTGSDEDDEPRRPIKRPLYQQPVRNPTQNGFPGSRNLGVFDGSSNHNNSNSSTRHYYDS
ncbi:SUMO ligase siz1 [Arachnomyces sp. PD_36]|nr:SUMO ligase siz1 [Arachnomyces sp. PD_36]